MMRRPKKRAATEGGGTEALADDAGIRAMVDLMLGTTALLLVVLLAIGAQAMRQPASSADDTSADVAGRDAFLARVDGPVIFAGRDGIRLAGGARIVAIGELAGSDLLSGIRPQDTPTLVIAPDGIEAAFHLTARLAALGITSVRRVRMAVGCEEIGTIEVGPSRWRISCRRP